MGFAEAMAHLDALGIDVMKKMRPSMHRIEALCDALNHPERTVPAIHVTGTNGKTSTARIAASVLTATGLSAGTYTSPHLQTITERIVLAGEPISASDFGDVFDHLHPFLQTVEQKLGEGLTYFEVLTGMFFLWAAEAPVDAMVVEVGLGGRWDATNVVDAPVSVVTNVGLDHTKLLGDDRKEIAREKSGIIKKDAVAVTGERDPAVLAVIEGEASGVGATTSRLGRDFDVVGNRLAWGGRHLSIRTSASNYESLFLPLHGAHQGVNAAVALEAVARFLPGRLLDEEVVAEGLARAAVPGRLEVVRSGEGVAPIVLDVAHNPDGMSALIASLAEAFTFTRVSFVVGILSDKDYVGMLTEVARLPSSLIVTQPKTVRSVPIDDLKMAAAEIGLACEAIDDVPDAVDAAVGGAAPEELVCITGSHYVVGEARTHLLGEPAT